MDMWKNGGEWIWGFRGTRFGIIDIPDAGWSNLLLKKNQVLAVAGNSQIRNRSDAAHLLEALSILAILVIGNENGNF